MTRPKINTASYFSHDAYHGSTIRILKAKWKSTGYAFWFQLLEQLTATEDHFIDLTIVGKFEDLCATIGCEEKVGNEILSMLAKLEAINSELWETSRIIWCQKLVNRLADVYKNRKRDVPVKPQNKIITPESGFSTNSYPGMTGITIPSYPQSKVKESKVKESKVKESKVKESKELKSLVRTPENPECGRLANLLFQKILDRNPNHKIPNFSKWCIQIRLMIDTDKRDPTEIESVIEWCQANSFWQNNILSTDKLREQYDHLILKMNSNNKPKSRHDENMEVIRNSIHKAQEEEHAEGNNDQISGDVSDCIPGKKDY